jgi:hypothetical protein
MTQEEFYIKLHRRIAQSCVGASAIRNQGKKGDKGLIKTCRTYFEHQIDVAEVFTLMCPESEYTNYLNKHTNNIVLQFPETAQSWGAARKGLNLFFRDLCYNRYFADRFSLPTEFNQNGIVLQNLEVPLDKDVAKGLRKRFKRQLPKWPGIKNLTSEISNIYQGKASEFAKEEKIARVHLDIMFWRDGK